MNPNIETVPTTVPIKNDLEVDRFANLWFTTTANTIIVAEAIEENIDE